MLNCNSLCSTIVHRQLYVMACIVLVVAQLQFQNNFVSVSMLTCMTQLGIETAGSTQK